MERETAILCPATKNPDPHPHRCRLGSSHPHDHLDRIFDPLKERNETIHGHDLSTQQQSRRRTLGTEMQLLHSDRDQVLACNSNIFIGDNSEDLVHYLDVATATQVQNWIHVWKPLILSSLLEAQDRSI